MFPLFWESFWASKTRFVREAHASYISRKVIFSILCPTDGTILYFMYSTEHTQEIKFRQIKTFFCFLVIRASFLDVSRNWLQARLFCAYIFNEQLYQSYWNR